MVVEDGCEIKHCGIKICKAPLWEEKYKDFSLWLQEVKTYKCATQDINGLKEVPGPQLALDLPEGNESELEIFDTFDTKEMKGENGWNAVIDLLKLHYKTGNSREAFNTWKKFKTCCEHGHPVDEYTIHFENYKTKMQ